MMIPMCRGRSAESGTGTAAGAGGRCMVTKGTFPGRACFDPPSDLEDLRLLALDQLIDPGHESVGDLLHLRRGPVDVVDAGLSVLLDLAHAVDLVAPDVADGDPRLLGVLAHHLDELLA